MSHHPRWVKGGGILVSLWIPLVSASMFALASLFVSTVFLELVEFYQPCIDTSLSWLGFGYLTPYSVSLVKFLYGCDNFKAISWTSRWNFAKLARIYYWHMPKSWLDFDLDLIFKQSRSQEDMNICEICIKMMNIWSHWLGSHQNCIYLDSSKSGLCFGDHDPCSKLALLYQQSKVLRCLSEWKCTVGVFDGVDLGWWDRGHFFCLKSISLQLFI